MMWLFIYLIGGLVFMALIGFPWTAKAIKNPKRAFIVCLILYVGQAAALFFLNWKLKMHLWE